MVLRLQSFNSVKVRYYPYCLPSISFTTQAAVTKIGVAVVGQGIAVITVMSWRTARRHADSAKPEVSTKA